MQSFSGLPAIRENPIDESGKRAPPVLWPNGHIFLYNMSITEDLSQIAADGIDNAQLPPETILHLPTDFPLLFSCNIKIIIICFFIILFGRAQHLGIGKNQSSLLPPISPVKDDGQTAYRRSSLPIVSFCVIVRITPFG